VAERRVRRPFSESPTIHPEQPLPDASAFLGTDPAPAIDRYGFLAGNAAARGLPQIPAYQEYPASTDEDPRPLPSASTLSTTVILARNFTFLYPS
jgi:hypothetical protein